MRAPVVLWQPHGDAGRELVTELAGGGDLPVVALQPDDRVRRLTETLGAAGPVVTSLSEGPPSLPDITRSLEDVLERWGPPSGLVLTPRPGPAAPFHELTLSDWHTVVEELFLGVVYLLRAIVPLTLASPGARVVTLLPGDPPVGKYARSGATANSALRAALEATLLELSSEPSATDIRFFTLREGWGLSADAAARVPAAARDDSPAALARLCCWLVREGPAELSGGALCVEPSSSEG